MSAKYDNMSEAELKIALEELLDRLEDTETLRGNVLGQTGHHIPGKYVKQFAAEIDELNSEIAAVKQLIQNKSTI